MKQGSQGSEWFKMCIDLERDKTMQLGFKAKRATLADGHIAVDNILHLDGACQCKRIN